MLSDQLLPASDVSVTFIALLMIRLAINTTLVALYPVKRLRNSKRYHRMHVLPDRVLADDHSKERMTTE